MECKSTRYLLARSRVDAEVTTIKEDKGLRTDLANYRNIFLPETVGKYFTSMDREGLNLHISERLLNIQQGFLTETSTEQENRNSGCY